MPKTWPMTRIFKRGVCLKKVSLEDSSTITIPGMSPKLVGTPGGTQWAGPKLGQHTEEVLTELLGMTAERLASLKNNAVI